MNYYDILNIDSDATKAEIEAAIVRYEDELFRERSNDKISAEESIQKRNELRKIEETLLDDSLRKEYDEFIVKSQEKKSGKKKGWIAAVATGTVTAAIAFSVLVTPLRDNISNLFIRTGTTPTQQEVQVTLAEDTEETKEQNQETIGDQTQDTTEEQKNFTEDELEELIEEGIVIKKRYGNSMFFVYCIEVPNGTNNRFVPNGYKMFEELRGFKYGETSQIIYERTGIYHAEKKEYSRIKTK